MEQNQMDCQSPPETTILCANNCGFFGCAATMNMCSKCHKDVMIQQEQAKLAASSIESIVNGSTSTSEKSPPVSVCAEPEVILTKPSCASEPKEIIEKVKQGPNRCTACRKRVGLAGFNCRCGNLFCSIHRYSDKHKCAFDYRTAARDAISKANPVVKAQKLNRV